MDLGLTGKSTIITGGSGGIGRGLVLGFAEEGANVVVATRDAAKGQEVADAAKAFPGEVVVIATDVTDEAQARVLSYIDVGKNDGAKLHFGGDAPDLGGAYVNPTMFADVNNDMTIAREEIFGPVLSIIPYENEDEAISIANDTPYGLSGYVEGDPEEARAIARRIRCGQVHINGAPYGFSAPFGGFKQSGNGRECAEFGIEEFLETRALLGYGSNTKRGDEAAS